MKIDYINLVCSNIHILNQLDEALFMIKKIITSINFKTKTTFLLYHLLNV